MNNSPTTIEVVTVIALIAGPVIAVIVTLWYQKRSEKRAAKERLFSVLMAHRRSNPPNLEWVQALNLIDVVFQDKTSVVNKWRELYDLLNQPPERINWIQVGHVRIELLSEIAIALGYRRLKQTDIDRYYAPQVLTDQATMQGDMQKELLRVLRDTKSLRIDPKK
jgi:hypothetical protein